MTIPKSHQLKDFLFPLELCLAKKGVSRKELFREFYEIDKFMAWMNFFPFVWLNSPAKYFEVGCEVFFNFLIPPFRYKMTCVSVIQDEYLEGMIDGLMVGCVSASFSEDSNSVFLRHPLRVCGKNLFVHFYYFLFLRPPHLPFMNWRLKKLKEKLYRKRMKQWERI